jgi:uncharacterized protein (TIGR02646 family)
MKRSLPLEESPALLTRYLQESPPTGNGPRDWDAFKQNARDAYKDLVDRLVARQRGLCAFCEIHLLAPRSADDREVEHWHPKQDSHVHKDWTFDIANLHASCTGGSRVHYMPENSNPEEQGALQAHYGDPFPRPNRSCGSFKGGSRPNAQADLEKQPLRPGDLPETPCLFHIDSDGVIRPDGSACGHANIPVSRVQATISFLNLDCTRLRHARAATYGYLEQLLQEKLAALTDDLAALDELALEVIWLDERKRLPEFLTTIRTFIGPAADRRLHDIPDWAAAPVGPQL